MLALLLVAVSMAAQDILATLCTIAEAQGRAMVAGAMDAAGDAARLVGYALGAGEIAVHGWNLYAAEVLAVMAATSFLATSATTRWAHRHNRTAL